MKAWHCAGDFSDFYGGHLLVFAETRGKARSIYLQSDWEPEDILAFGVRRAPKYDGMQDAPGSITDNNQIKDGYPSFYSESEDEEDQS